VKKVPDKDPAALREYEKELLEAVMPNGVLDKLAFSRILINAIRTTNSKLRGFSRRETRDYYKDIVKRAWDMVEAAKTPDVQVATLDDEFEWLLADDKFNRRSKDIFGHSRVYHYPYWLGGGHYTRSAPAGTGTLGTAGSGAATGGGGISLPSLPGADFANSIVSSVENMANSIVSSAPTLNNTVMATTNPQALASASSSSSGGGGCACACAGCACACAGGGR
jgi:hypothetical protein